MFFTFCRVSCPSPSFQILNGRESMLSLTGSQSSNGSNAVLCRVAPSLGAASLSTSLSTPSATPALLRRHCDLDCSDTEAAESELLVLPVHSPRCGNGSSCSSTPQPAPRQHRDSASSTEEFAL